MSCARLHQKNCNVCNVYNSATLNSNKHHSKRLFPQIELLSVVLLYVGGMSNLRKINNTLLQVIINFLRPHPPPPPPQYARRRCCCCFDPFSLHSFGVGVPLLNFPPPGLLPIILPTPAGVVGWGDAKKEGGESGAPACVKPLQRNRLGASALLGESILLNCSPSACRLPRSRMTSFLAESLCRGDPHDDPSSLAIL